MRARLCLAGAPQQTLSPSRLVRRAHAHSEPSRLQVRASRLRLSPWRTLLPRCAGKLRRQACGSRVARRTLCTGPYCLSFAAVWWRCLFRRRRKLHARCSWRSLCALDALDALDALAVLAQLARGAGFAARAAVADQRIHRRGLVGQVVAFGLGRVGNHAVTIAGRWADSRAARGTARKQPGHW